MNEPMDSMQRSIMFEKFLTYKGYEFNLEPSTKTHGDLAYVVKGHLEGKGLMKCVCALEEIRYFAGDLRVQEIDWEHIDYPKELKGIIASGGEELVLANIPKIFSYLGISLYQQFVLWRMENGI